MSSLKLEPFDDSDLCPAPNEEMINSVDEEMNRLESTPLVDEEMNDIPMEECSDENPNKLNLNRNQCPVCLAQFALEKNYVEHMWNVHGNKRPFRCDDCGLYLSYRSSLYNHRKIHSDKRPFCCTECSSRFRWNNSLKYHMKRAHNKEPPWVSSRRLIQVDKQARVAQPRKAAPKPKNTNVETPSTSSQQNAEATKAIETSGRGKRLVQVSWLEPKFCSKCKKKFFLESAFIAHQEACTKKTVLETIRSIQLQEKERQQLLDEARKLAVDMSGRNRFNTRKNLKNPIISASPPGLLQNGPIEQQIDPNFTLPMTHDQNGTTSAIEAIMRTGGAAGISQSPVQSPPCDATLDLRIGSLPNVGNESTLDVRLNQIYARQETLLRRLESFELWVQQRVTKMETILAALVSTRGQQQ